jgi:hypothetical protein
MKDFIEMMFWMFVWTVFATFGISIMAAFAHMLGFWVFTSGEYPGTIAIHVQNLLPGKSIFFIYIFPALALPFLFWASRKARKE